MVSNYIGGQGLDAGRPGSFHGRKFLMNLTHPATPDRQSHIFHATSHFVAAVVIANPNTSGIFGGEAHHPTILGVVCGTGLQRKLPGTFVATKNLWLATEVAGPRVAEHVANN